MIDLIAQTGIDYAESASAQSAVKEQQQVHETEEKEDRPSFDELLAGILHDDIPTTDFSGIEIADAALSEYAEPEKLDHPGMSELNYLSYADADTENISGIDSSAEDKDILLSAEHFFSRSMELPSGSDNAEELLPVIPDMKKDRLAELKQQSDISSSVKDPAELNPASQKHASELASVQNQGEQNVKQNIASDSKKEQILSKNDNAEAHSAMIKTGDKNPQAGSEYSRNGQEDRGLLDEIRNRSRHDRIAFEVRDQRTSAEISHNNQTQSFMSVEAAAAQMTDSQVPDITLELRLPDYNNSGQNAQTTWEGKAANALENMLARELHQNFNGDIVRHASMALRDGGESIIKLALRPETLGNVKIHLEMSENKITGFIIVESEEALNAFRKEIASLEQTFRDAGFADASLDLSLADDGRNAWNGQEEDIFTAQMVASSYENSLRDADLDSAALTGAFGEGSGSVNMLA